jgi:tetratricopeptide (TPR) repeat protein
MKPSDAIDEVARQIADAAEPDWGSISDAPDALPGLQLLHDIASSFRSGGSEAEPEPALFEWRHLEVRETIGEGAFGVVYRAHDPVLRREVALKLAHERPGQAPSQAPSREVVIAEARSMARVRHPNILAIHGADTADERVGIWSDLLQGRTLEAVLEETGRLPPRDLIDLSLQLADALSLVHRRGLVHGDIKPANIMIQRDGTPVLMDFGAAREQGGRIAVALGSPRFMAPEQFAGQAATPACDLFAFGVVIFQALSGRYPWPADSLEALETAHEQGDDAAMRGIPWRFRRLLKDLLARDPHDRPDAEQLVLRLRRLRTARRRLLRKTAVGVVVGSLALGLVAAVLAFQAEQQSRERVQALRDLVVGSLQAADPERTSGPTSVKVIYEGIAERMEDALADDPGALAEMRLMVGSGIGRLGDREAGLEILERALADLDPDAARFARRRSEAWLAIAELKTDLEDLDGAEIAVRNAIEETSRRIDPDGPSQQLIARNKLMRLLGEQGRTREQLAVQIALLADREALHGKGTLATAVDHHNLANLYQRLGRYDEALVHEREAETLLLANGDGESLRAGFVSIALAGIEVDRGDFDAAQRSLDRAAALYGANLPAGHPSFFEIEGEQGRLWRLAGRHTDARRLFQEHLALDAADVVQHRQKAQLNLAYIAISEGTWAEAQSLLVPLAAAKAPRLAPLQSYLEAAAQYVAARRAPEMRTGAIAALRAVIDDFEARELTAVEPYRNARAWLAAIEAPGS